MDHNEREKRKINPREKANLCSLITFAYTRGLFRKAYKNDLEEEDLYEVLARCNSKRCGDKLQTIWQKGRKTEKRISIYELLWRRYGVRYILTGMTYLIWKTFQNITEPWAISNLVSYFTPGQTRITRYDAYLYGLVMLSIYLTGCLFLHNYIIWVIQLGIEIKTSFASMLYRKALRLTPSAIADISLGNIVTLITKDVHTFQMSIWIINDTWIGIVQTCIVCYLLYLRIGVMCFVGVAILIAAMPLQVFMGRYVSKMRLNVGKKSDERLQVTQETLSAIRIIKSYTWEKFFGEKVNASRVGEMNSMLLGFYLKICIVILGVLFSKIGLYALIMAYVWSGGSVDPQTIFYILSIFKELKTTIGVHIPYGMGRAAEFYSAMIRINKVLEADELQPRTGIDGITEKPLVELKDASVHIKDFEILKKISLKIDSGLTLVTGTVGSGKSALLKTMLEDYPLSTGTIHTRGRISYASQDPWLFPSSIRQNILFGETYDEARYQEVIRVCALQYDFSLFDKGDQTIVTDKGLNLSKGQQARVNLARAIYKESDIYLLDDSLTALDAHVQDFIFNECIKTYLKDKLIVLVTQTANHIREADNVVILDKGQIKSHGKPDEGILKTINELVVEDDDLEKEVVDMGKDKEKDDDKADEKTALLETEQTTKRKIYKEVKKKGKVEWTIYKKYLLFGGGIMLMALNVFLFGMAQATDSYSDQLLTKWVDEQHDVLMIRINLTKLESLKYGDEAWGAKKNSTINNIVARSVLGDVINDTNISNITDENFSSPTTTAPLIIEPTVVVSTTTFSSIVTSSPVPPSSTNPIPNTNTNNETDIPRLEETLEKAIDKEQGTIKLYSIMIFVSTAAAMIKTYAIFDYCRRASINIHKAMINNITDAVMSFFDTHFIGNILNRFSQDLNNIDEVLPFAFSEVFRVMFSVIGVVSLITLVNRPFLAYALVFIVIIYVLRWLYLPTGRSLKRLEASTRSPMIGHLNASLEGLTTIRAYKNQDILSEEFDRHQDLYTSAHYTSMCATRAFGMCIDMFCTALIASVVIRFLFVDRDTTAGSVGLALTQVFMLAGHVQWGVRQWAELENLMTSVERLLEYTEIKTENKEGIEIEDWPTQGAVKYENVYLSYNNSEMVLKNLNFEVEPKQKIGIVGRTGAGKSSIISTLFRLYEVEGKILIDGVDIKTLSLNFLRKKLAIIPQDPVLFTGTIRSNLDPFNEYSDDELWNALDKVGLKKLVTSLDMPISGTSSTFSSGQKQLVCLTRAILRKVKVVILDEATANMDHETDALLHQTIKENFSDCTVFAIAHRLHSILDCDKVMVLDRGEIKELDAPTTLLENKNGLFYKMVEQAGLLNYLS